MVTVTDNDTVAGYYCLSARARPRQATEPLAPRQPDPTPIVLLGRLAVDTRFHGHGLGGDLLQRATVDAAETIGMLAIRVRAITDEVVPFYERFEFTRFPDTSLTLHPLLADVRATFGAL